MERGFSVLEALVSMAIFLGIMAVTMTVYAPSRAIYTKGERKADIQQNARLAMAEISRQIRMAGYFPENFSDPPPATAVTDPIVVATDNTLAIHGDADSSGASNVFLFCLDGNRLRRTRAAKDTSAAYICTGGDVLAQGVSALRFTYYDAAGDPVPDPPAAPFKLDDQTAGGVPDLGDMTERGSIRRVVVTLSAEADTGHDSKQTFSLGSDVWLRNSG